MAEYYQNLDIVAVVTVLAFLGTVAAFVWRMASLAGKISQNETRLDDVFGKINTIKDRRERDNVEHTQQIMTMVQTLARVEERIAHILEELKTLKIKNN